MKNFEKEIEAAKGLPELMQIAQDLHELPEFEEPEKLLVQKSMEFLENATQLMELADLLGHVTNMNLLIQIYYEVEGRQIPNFETYFDLLRMVELESLYGVKARMALDKAAGEVLKISDSTSLARLISLAMTLTDFGDYDEEFSRREDALIAAILAKFEGDCEMTVELSRQFSMETLRNRFLLAFVKKCGVKDWGEAEMLSRVIKSDERFGAELKEAIREAAKEAGFEYDPDLESKLRQVRSLHAGAGFLSFILPLLLGMSGIGRRSILDLDLPQGFRLAEENSMPFGDECADCLKRDTEECVNCLRRLKEVLASRSASFGLGMGPMGSGNDPLDILRDLSDDPMADITQGRRLSRISIYSFQGFGLFSTLKPGICPNEGAPLVGYLPDFPPEILEQILVRQFNPAALVSQFGPGAGPEYIKSLLVPGGTLMSVPDILASEEARERIGPELTAVLERYVALFNPPEEG